MCYLYPKVPEPKPEEPQKPKDDGASLLALISPDRPCSCEVMARAVSSDVPRYLGLSDLRASMGVDREREMSAHLDENNPDTTQKSEPKKPTDK